MVKKEPELPIKINLNLGGLLGNVDLTNITELAGRLQELRRELEKNPALKDNIKTDYRVKIHGIGIRPIDVGTLPVGREKPFTERPITVKQGLKLQLVKPEEKVREPLVDVFTEKDEIKVITEVPGVQTENIKVNVVSDTTLVISAKNSDREYYKEVELPAAVTSDMTTAYKNGILEIVLKKKTGES